MAVTILPLSGCGREDSDTIVLRISNWEEYIDEGEWSNEDTIELPDGTLIQPENSMVSEGDEYDLVCPSEYMIMKLMTEGYVQTFSDEFMNESLNENYYVKGVSPYIRSVFDKLEIDGQKLSDCVAGYMWGTLGIVYNPDEVTMKEASRWKILNKKE